MLLQKRIIFRKSLRRFREQLKSPAIRMRWVERGELSLEEAFDLELKLAKAQSNFDECSTWSSRYGYVSWQSTDKHFENQWISWHLVFSCNLFRAGKCRECTCLIVLSIWCVKFSVPPSCLGHHADASTQIIPVSDHYESVPSSTSSVNSSLFS